MLASDETDAHDLGCSFRWFLTPYRRPLMTDENTDEDRTDQRTSLLIVFGMMFTTVGLAIGVTDAYGTLSFIFLGLGLVLPFIALILSIEEDEASGEE